MADYIIDLGPEGGDAGGEVIASGSPEKIIKNGQSYTAQYLKDTFADFPESDGRKILGENLLRVWKAVEDYAATTSSST